MSPLGVLESERRVLEAGEGGTGGTLGFPGEIGDWEVSEEGGAVSTLFPSCWLPARNEKGKASHPKK